MTVTRNTLLRCSRHWLDRRCREAGKLHGECDACIVETRGEGVLVIDTAHEACPPAAHGTRARKCDFVRNGEEFTCRSCGFRVTVIGASDETRPEAVCGAPKTVRVHHGPVVRGGAGTHLKGLLAAIGIRAGAGCKCGERARLMDTAGVEWCSKNVDLIVGWLAEEAKNRGIPVFSTIAARMLVLKAIRLARKDAVRAT